MEAVEKWATDDFRSINGQLEWIIHNALKDAKRLKKNTENGQIRTVQKAESTAKKVNYGSKGNFCIAANNGCCRIYYSNRNEFIKMVHI